MNCSTILERIVLQFLILVLYMSVNKLKDTTVYGNFHNKDLKTSLIDNTIVTQAYATFDRNLTVGGNIILNNLIPSILSTINSSCVFKIIFDFPTVSCCSANSASVNGAPFTVLVLAALLLAFAAVAGFVAPFHG